MTNALKAYPNYKDSRLSWLGQVPAHWTELRGRFLFQEIDERSNDGSEQLLSVSHLTGVTPRSEKNVTMFQAETYEGHKLARPSDIVVNTMWAWMAALGVSRHEGIVSLSYAVYRQRGPAFHPEYLDNLVRHPAYRDEYHSRSTGIRSSRLRLYPDQFLDIPFLLPPAGEQEVIVAFIRSINARVNRFIRAKRRLIELLNEQKQVIFHQAVTRGLDPAVPLKPSGVDWLGDIPAHWELSTVKREFHCLDRRRVPLSSDERGAMTSRRYNYYGASGIIDQVENYLFDDELILLAEDGANLVLRNLPLALIARGKFWVNNHAHVLKPKRGNLEYLSFLLETIDYRPWITGAAQPKLTGERLLSVAIAVPDPAEQRCIVAAMHDRTGSLTAAISRAISEVTLIREYRTRLIADVVTGKFDVREAAIGLPVGDYEETDTAEIGEQKLEEVDELDGADET